MRIPSTEDSLYDGSRQYHEFTDPVSSNFFDVLPSSPPEQEDSVMQIEDEDTDMDTDVDEPAAKQELMHTLQHHSTLRTHSNAAMASVRRSFSFETEASTFVQRVIDNPEEMIDNKGVLIVNFEQANLVTLPADFSDLHMLTPQPSQMKIFLGKNRLSTLPVCLFDMSNITVLSLRDNQLTSLPPAIMKLHNLTELHVGGNKLRWLPYEITKLPLTTLTLAPNPLLTPSSSTKNHSETIEEYRISDRCASLVDISIAKYLQTTYPQHLPRLPDNLQLRIQLDQALQNQCSMCGNIYVHEAAAMIRWNTVFRQSNVPLKLGFCSTACYSRYCFPHSSDYM